MEQKQLKQGEVINEKGNKCEYFITVLQGTLAYGNQMFEKGQMFGE